MRTLLKCVRNTLRNVLIEDRKNKCFNSNETINKLNLYVELPFINFK